MRSWFEFGYFDFDLPIRHVSWPSGLFQAIHLSAILRSHNISDNWYYKDDAGEEQGPFAIEYMHHWYSQDYFSNALLIRAPESTDYVPLTSVFPDLASAFKRPQQTEVSSISETVETASHSNSLPSSEIDTEKEPHETITKEFRGGRKARAFTFRKSYRLLPRELSKIQRRNTRHSKRSSLVVAEDGDFLKAAKLESLHTANTWEERQGNSPQLLERLHSAEENASRWQNELEQLRSGVCSFQEAGLKFAEMGRVLADTLKRCSRDGIGVLSDVPELAGVAVTLEQNSAFNEHLLKNLVQGLGEEPTSSESLNDGLGHTNSRNFSEARQQFKVCRKQLQKSMDEIEKCVSDAAVAMRQGSQSTEQLEAALNEEKIARSFALWREQDIFAWKARSVSHLVGCFSDYFRNSSNGTGVLLAESARLQALYKAVWNEEGVMQYKGEQWRTFALQGSKPPGLSSNGKAKDLVDLPGTFGRNLTISCSGHLLKMASGFLSSWQPRMFILQGAQLFYLRKNKADFAFEEIPVGNVSNCKVARKDPAKAIFDLEIDAPSQDDDAQEHQLSRVASVRLAQTIAPIRRHKALKSGRVKLLQLQAPNRRAMHNWTQALEQRIESFRKLKRHNRQCAECGDVEPQWAVIAYGILVCDRCMCGHSYIAQPRHQILSLNSRDWTDSLIGWMLEQGNSRVNNFFEHAFSQNSEIKGMGKVSPLTVQNDATLRKWVTEKYIKQTFVSDCARTHCEHDSEENWKLLHTLNNSSNFTEAARSMLHSACSSGDLSAMELLIMHGVVPSLLDKQGNTPLASAAKHNSTAECLANTLDQNCCPTFVAVHFDEQFSQRCFIYRLCDFESLNSFLEDLREAHSSHVIHIDSRQPPLPQIQEQGTAVLSGADLASSELSSSSKRSLHVVPLLQVSNSLSKFVGFCFGGKFESTTNLKQGLKGDQSERNDDSIDSPVLRLEYSARIPLSSRMRRAEASEIHCSSLKGSTACIHWLERQHERLRSRMAPLESQSGVLNDSVPTVLLREEGNQLLHMLLDVLTTSLLCPVGLKSSGWIALDCKETTEEWRRHRKTFLKKQHIRLHKDCNVRGLPAPKEPDYQRLIGQAELPLTSRLRQSHKTLMNTIFQAMAFAQEIHDKQPSLYQQSMLAHIESLVNRVVCGPAFRS
eukprot:TRINITY_DN1628_c0_g1_i3.p1 TRINITY_DN1628_c0_g1~~TRINITY_DN1628_c0_g1_i3.p1  ORF type:complete len:1224 (+),score=181.04 TRINITY_DN1628_c0_g1_i3:192-3674(+)